MWVLTIIIAAFIILGFVMGLLALAASQGELNPFTHLFFLPLLTTIYGLIGLLLTREHAGNILGWLLLALGSDAGVILIAGASVHFSQYVLEIQSGAIVDFAAWLNRWVWLPGTFIPVTLLLLYFPDGRLPSHRWRWIAVAAGLGLLGVTLGLALHPDPLPEFGMNAANPFGLAGAQEILMTVTTASAALLLAGMVGSFVSIVVRYRRTTGRQRTQLRWLIFGGILFFLANVVGAILWAVNPTDPASSELSIIFSNLGITLIVISIGIAILRHQLWDISLLINRTLVYGLLTLIISGMYVLVVGFLTSVFEGSTALSAMVTAGLVAVSFQTVREFIQAQISRLMFGQRDDPYAVLQQLAERLSPIAPVPDLLPAIVTTIAETLSVPYAAVRLRRDRRETLAAVYPAGATKPPHVSTETIPLVYQSEQVGHLVIATRGIDDVFTPSEQRLLDTIARQVAVAAFNVRLTEDLQRSREQIVTAREEERRRLRRDLHDGLGPVLAAMSFQLDAIRNTVGTDPDHAQQIADQLKAQVQNSLADIRRIAYNLRPPALDELGLLGALRQHIDRMRQGEGPAFALSFPESLPALSAAAEVAAYRIAVEALTNVQRHAQARTCTVMLELDTAGRTLHVQIGDDGRGINAEAAAGVGIAGMRERAAELGGSISVTSPVSGGTRVDAWLPVGNTEE
ncbi:MAG: hypothetical protein IPM16_01095 [Chloroflexi bacterium]|nr:hypothetical protein [Chloroflexota bacterium]